jgi:hypothetical protein
MKKINKHFAFIIPCLLMLLTLQKVKAQDAQAMLKESTPEQRAQMQTGMMKSKLNLDSAQTIKVQAINLKYAQQLDPVLKGDGAKFKKLKEAMSIQKAKDADLKTVLTADQNKQYEAMKEEMKEKLKEYKKS